MARKIEEKIKTCYAFVPFLTENFRESDWTGQEVGIAVGARRNIFPISIDRIIALMGLSKNTTRISHHVMEF